jgi:hypothetical protein
MGFGLTISKMIVTQLKGEIRMESIVGFGSNFNFIISVDDSFDSNVEESKSSNSIGE